MHIAMIAVLRQCVPTPPEKTFNLFIITLHCALSDVTSVPSYVVLY